LLFDGCSNTIDRIVIQKEAGSKLENKNQNIGNQCLWNSKSFVTPVFITATGIASKELKIYLQIKPGNRLILSLQETSHIIRKVLRSKN